MNCLHACMYDPLSGWVRVGGASPEHKSCCDGSRESKLHSQKPEDLAHKTLFISTEQFKNKLMVTSMHKIPGLRKI